MPPADDSAPPGAAAGSWTGSLTFATLPVIDLDAGARFYEKVFGWRPVRRLADALFFKHGSLTLVLLERNAFQQFVGLDDNEARPAGAVLSWNLPSAAAVNALVRHACDEGASTRRAPSSPAWGGWAGIVETPDGHLWEIVWNPKRTGASSPDA